MTVIDAVSLVPAGWTDNPEGWWAHLARCETCSQFYGRRPATVAEAQANLVELVGDVNSGRYDVV